MQGDSLLRRGGSARGRGRGGAQVATAAGNIIRIRDKTAGSIPFDFDQVRGWLAGGLAGWLRSPSAKLFVIEFYQGTNNNSENCGLCQTNTSPIIFIENKLCKIVNHLQIVLSGNTTANPIRESVTSNYD